MFRSKLNISNQSHHEQSPQQLTNGSGGEKRTALVGKETGNYSEFIFNPNEYITFFNFRDGAWMDAVQFELIKEESHQCLVMLMEDIYLHSMRQMMILKLLNVFLFKPMA